jgi:putative ABC transport system permease protein
MSAMFGVVRSNVVVRRRRLAGASVAVVLGVAFLVATLTVSDTLQAGFDTLFTSANAGVDVVVRDGTELGVDGSAQRGLLDESLEGELGDVPGVADVVPRIEGVGQIVGADGAPIGGDGPPTAAGNWIDDDVLNPWTLVDGRAPLAAGEAVVDRASARAGGLEVGDVAAVLVPRRVEVTVVGIAAFGELDSIGPSTYVAFETETARQLLIGGAGVSSYLVSAAPGSSPEEVRDAVRTVLPDRVVALTGEELAAQELAELQGDFLGFVEVFLLAFAGIALLVAAFSIHNTLTILVAQRTRESALLRAVGGTRRQVLAATVGEAVVLGVVASTIGLAVGYGLGVGLRALMASAGIDLPGTGLVVNGSTVAAAFAVGVGVTVVASLAPAVRASRVAPLAALRDVEVDRSHASGWRAWAGAVALGTGVVLTVVAGRNEDGALERAGIGAVLVVVGIVVLGPALAGAGVRLLGAPVARLRGPTGRLAVGNATRNPRRTASSAASLLVATAVVTLFATMGASVSASIDATVDRSFGGDLVISQESFSGATIDPALTPALDALPETRAVASISVVPALVDGRDVEPVAVDPAALDDVLDVDVTSGSLAEMGPGELAVSDDEAEAHGWDIGTVLPVQFVDGSVVDATVTVRYGSTDLMGDVMMHVDDWRPHARSVGDVAVLVGFAAGVDDAAALDAVSAVTEQYGAPTPQTRDEYVESVAGEIDQLLVLVYGLLALAVLIGLMGIANTLSLSIHERTREIALLRAVGQTRAQARAAIRWESLLTALFGTVGGVTVGVFLGWGLVRAVAAQEGLGTFTAPTGTIVAIVALAAVAGTVAAFRPARRAARLDIVTALGAA